MKSTIIVLVILCLVVGGILGWVIRGRTTASTTPVAVVNLSRDRVGLYDGASFTVVQFSDDSGGYRVEQLASLKIK